MELPGAVRYLRREDSDWYPRRRVPLRRRDGAGAAVQRERRPDHADGEQDVERQERKGRRKGD